MQIILQHCEDDGDKFIYELLAAAHAGVWSDDLVIAMLAAFMFGERGDFEFYYAQRKQLISALKKTIADIEECKPDA